MIATVAGWVPQIDAYHGRVLWTEQSPGGYRLMEYRDGVVRPLPVPSSTIPFEVDLGPDRHRRIVAVYPRCTEVLFTIDYGAPLGCDLYLYDFRRGPETPIRRANSVRTDERYPAIWKGRLVFARPSGFYWRSLTSRGHNRLLKRATEWVFPSGADLRGKLAALSYSYPTDSGDLELVQIGGRVRNMHARPVGSASIGPRFVYWLDLQGTRYNGYQTVLTRYDRVSESGDTDLGTVMWGALSFAHDGSASYYTAPLPGTCRYCPGPHGLYRATGIRF